MKLQKQWTGITAEKFKTKHKGNEMSKYINIMTQKECYKEITELGHRLNKKIKVINNDLMITLRRYTEELLNSKQWTGNMAQKFEELKHQCDDTYAIGLQK